MTIYEDSPAETNDANEPIENATVVASDVPAEKLQPIGRERDDSDQQIALTRTVFRMRYREDLNRRMWIEFSGERYNIESINDRRGTRQEIEITTTVQE